MKIRYQVRPASLEIVNLRVRELKTFTYNLLLYKNKGPLAWAPYNGTEKEVTPTFPKRDDDIKSAVKRGDHLAAIHYCLEAIRQFDDQKETLERIVPWFAKFINHHFVLVEMDWLIDPEVPKAPKAKRASPKKKAQQPSLNIPEGDLT